MRRRWIVIGAVLCQLLTTAPVHVPMQPARVTAAEARSAAHCSHAARTRDAGSTAPHACHCGLCQCLGAPPAAIGTDAAPMIAAASFPLLPPYRAADVPERTFTFFRPPI